MYVHKHLSEEPLNFRNHKDFHGYVEDKGKLALTEPFLY